MRVTFAREYESQDGKKHKADSTADLPTDEARNLLYEGKARLPDAKSDTTTSKKEG